MNASRFDQIVKNRAKQRFDTRIAACRTSMEAAVMALTGRGRPYRDWWEGEEARAIIAALTSNKWPSFILKREADLVEAELLATMDEMQKALIAPPPDPNDGPQVIEEVKGGTPNA